MNKCVVIQFSHLFIPNVYSKILIPSVVSCGGLHSEEFHLWCIKFKIAELGSVEDKKGQII